MPVTADDFKKWEPSPTQKIHGSMTYASRLIREGLRFEQEGNKLQAELRYAKCRAYCSLNKLPFPPFSMTPTEILAGVVAGGGPQVEWKRGEKAEMPAGGPRSGRKSKEKPAAKTRKPWSGDKEVAKEQGRVAYLHRLLNSRDEEGAVRFAAKYAIDLAAFKAKYGFQIDTEASAPITHQQASGTASSETSGVEPNGPRDPEPVPEQTPKLRPFSLDPTPHELVAMFPDLADVYGIKRSSGAAAKPQSEAGALGAAEAAASEPISDAVATPEPEEGQRGSMEAGRPLESAPAAASEQSSGGQLPHPPVAEITPKAMEGGATPPEPPVAPLRILKEPTMLERPRIIRQAVVWSLPRNPRLTAIKLLDTGCIESKWREHNDKMRINQIIEVVLSEGVPGHAGKDGTAIYEEIPPV